MQPFIPLKVGFVGNKELKTLVLIEANGIAKLPIGKHIFSGYYLNELIKRLRTEGINVFMLELSQQGELGYGCGWHPNIAQDEKNGKELYDFLRSEV